MSGGIVLSLLRQGGNVIAAEVVSTRPQAARLLVGKTPEQATQLVPLLFSLCGGAQGVAAKAALLAAQGQTSTPEQRTIWENIVRREAAMEHLWRLLLDWPQACGLSRREEEYAACRRACRQAQMENGFMAVLESVLVAELLGMPVRNWLSLDQTSWQAWREFSPSLAAKLLRQLNSIAYVAKPAVKCLPTTTAKDWAGQAEMIATPDFCGAPAWLGEPCETGALARQLGHVRVAMLLAEGRNVEARLVARLIELAQWTQRDQVQLPTWTDAVSCENGMGLAQVETARGILLHRVRVENDVVTEYAIVAPTEWNFHPQGAFVREAPSLGAADEEVLLRQARWLALSLDPCVEFGIKISHA